MNNQACTKKHIAVTFFSGELICEISEGATKNQDRISTNSDFITGMTYLWKIHEQLGKASDVVLYDLWNWPLIVLSDFREFLISHGVPVKGFEHSKIQSVDKIPFDLSSQKYKVSQRVFKDGPLAGTPIRKFAWYDEKYIHVEPCEAGYALYGKRNVLGVLVDVVFLGTVAKQPVGYLPFLTFELDSVRDFRESLRRIEDRLNSMPQNNIAQLEVKYMGTAKFAIQPSPGPVWVVFANWIGNGYPDN